MVGAPFTDRTSFRRVWLSRLEGHPFCNGVILGPTPSGEDSRMNFLRLAPRDPIHAGILYEMCFNLKLSGNEVHYTILKILLVKIMLCSKLHCQKLFKLKHISYEIARCWRCWGGRSSRQPRPSFLLTGALSFQPYLR